MVYRIYDQNLLCAQLCHLLTRIGRAGSHFDRKLLLGPSLLGEKDAARQVLRRVPDTEYANSEDHGNGLEYPEKPLRTECISIHTLGKLAHSVNTADL